ncbi:MAG: hypothetical protein AAF401_02815 [Pseudomonadota bacterium]
MSSLNFALIAFAVCVIALGQTAMKYAAQKITTSAEQTWMGFAQANIYPIMIIALAMGFYVVSTIAWVAALRSTPLSVAYMFNAVAFVIVPVLAVAIFSEQLPKFYFPSLGLILLAIFLISRG